ncbi:MAG: 1-deoxy-D-xylulose-5-phosphate synthase [Clostridiales bacterium]|nr:1-deoxy-D-xylulose-5-phosphate synthase [Clostridiales bacterium]MDY5468492.1 1-deoxy-D-xylulose-5-phosphate synthase [Eubacteriales bacterium]
MVLERIHSSEDVKRLSSKELSVLAQELRARIIDSVSRNGGHLASNLGVVELTIALHRAFDFPKDALIFDVGHQCYAHKLLTGRADSFDTLRQFGGLAGFPRREESPYDAFDTGHASTAISAAAGMARARDLVGGSQSVVAVVGDGALTGGMCYEALSDAGSSKLRMIVVLNDNGMSISRNVGAVSRYLTHMRSSKGWFEAKHVVGDFLRRIPVVGNSLHAFFQRIKNSLRNIFVQDRLFDSLGFHYLGPVDGRDITGLERLFRRARQLDEPVLIHVVTKKGRGYSQAESDPTRLHGTPPFDVHTGEPLSPAGKSMGKAAGDALCAMAAADSRIVAVTAAMTGSTGLGEFASRYPDRLYDVGIAEEHAVTMAAGLAAGGARPFVAIYDSFLQRAYDQILLDVCEQHLPVCFLVDRAGLIEDGVTHQGVYGNAFLTQMPGLTVLNAATCDELQAMIRYALTLDAPVAIRYGKTETENVAVWPREKPYAPMWPLLRTGDELAILACGAMVGQAMRAAELLDQQSLRCAVYAADCIQPLDENVLNQLKDSKLVTLEEGVVSGGLSSLVPAWRAAHGVCKPLLTLGVEGLCATQGDHTLQLRAQGLDAESVARRIAQWNKESKA